MSEPHWLDDAQQHHWRAYLRGTRLLERALVEGLAPHKVQLTEYELLSMLSESPGQRTRMSALADDIVQSRSRVTHTASRLEKRGMVERRPCSSDARGTEAHLTDAGFALLEQAARHHVTNVREMFLDHISDEEFCTLGDAMGRVHGHLAAREARRA